MISYTIACAKLYKMNKFIFLGRKIHDDNLVTRIAEGVAVIDSDTLDSSASQPIKYKCKFH